MSTSGISKIGVLGIGTMGSGIAQVSAQSGFETIVADVSDEVLEKGMARIHKSLDKLVASYEKTEGKRGITKEHRDEAAGRLKSSAKMDDLLDRDIIIEAVFEDYDVKAKLIKELDGKGFDGLFASNTSSISITRLANNYHDPARFMGMHFMNPVPIQKGVEIIRGLLTGDEMYNTIVALCGDMGKTPIPAEDKAGFGITSRTPTKRRCAWATGWAPSPRWTLWGWISSWMSATCWRLSSGRRTRQPRCSSGWSKRATSG